MKQRLTLHQGEVQARTSVLLSPPYQGRLGLQAAEQGYAGGLGRREGFFDGSRGMGQGVCRQVSQWEDPGVRQQLCLPRVAPPP